MLTHGQTLLFYIYKITHIGKSRLYTVKKHNGSSFDASSINKNNLQKSIDDLLDAEEKDENADKSVGKVWDGTCAGKHKHKSKKSKDNSRNLKTNKQKLQKIS